MKQLLTTLVIFISMTATAETDKTKEEWIAEAKTEAQKIFNDYYAICNGHIVIRVGQSYFYEFSGNKADVEVFGLYHLYEEDKLNGKLWSGKMVVEMGDSARSITIGADGVRKVSEWGYGREAEFDFVFADGRWQLSGMIQSYSKSSFSLKPGVSCSKVGL